LSYGPHQDFNRFIPQAISAGLRNEEFNMTAGEQTREFNYVSDIVDGILKASLSPEAIGEIINIGNGIEYRIKDVVNRIFQITGSQVKPRFGALLYRPGETWHFYCDNSKAKKLLQWELKIDLDTGLELTAEWYRKNLMHAGNKG
jgi:nucleoside-diphosphate-sugar epimerase